MSRIAGAKNVYRGWIYDRNIIHPEIVTSRLIFFVNPRGNPDPEKNIKEKGSADTNMDVGGQLTGVNSFMIESMEALVTVESVEDREALRRASFCLIINSIPIPDPLPFEVLMKRKLEFDDPHLVSIDPGDTFCVEVAFTGGIKPEKPIEILLILWGKRCKPIMDDLEGYVDRARKPKKKSGKNQRRAKVVLRN